VALLDQARAWGVPDRCVGANAGAGDNPYFLAALEARPETVCPERLCRLPGEPPAPGEGPALRVDRLLQALPRRLWRGAVGAPLGRANGRSDGCWVNAPHVGRRRSGSTPGASCRPRPRWKSWPALPIDSMSSNSFMNRKGRGAGLNVKGGCGRASTGMRSRSCWPTASWSGWSAANGADREAAVAPATRFPPRPDRWRQTLPAIHCEVARWLRPQAVQWWVTTNRCIELCSQRF
jgi:hypothetical protein